MNTVEQVLAHFGVKGMRWGVRRSRAQLKGASPDAAKAASVKVAIKKGGGAHAVSNTDLQVLVTRMNLEQQYSKLSASSKKKSLGSKYISTFLNTASNNEIQSLARGQRGPLLSQLDKLLAGGGKHRRS